MDIVLQQRLIFWLAVVALVTAGIAIWQSVSRVRTVLIILAWSAGLFLVGTLLVASLHGRTTGNIPLYLSLVGIIAASVGQLTRHGGEKALLTSPQVRTEKSGPVANERLAQTNIVRRETPRPRRDWAWVTELWIGITQRRSGLILFAVIAGLTIVLLIRHRSGTRPASLESGSSAIQESGELPVKESWTYHTGVPWKSSADFWRTPAIGSDGTIYVLGESQIFAVSASGELKWRYPDSGLPRFGSLDSVLIANDGAVWGGTKIGWLIRITDQGEAQPQFGGAVAINQMALSSAGVLLICGDNMSDTITTNGYPKEPRDIAGSISPNLGLMKGAAFGPNMVVTIAEDKLTSWSEDFRQTNWQKEIGSGCHRPSIAKDGTIYVACREEMAAINADGTSKWSFPVKIPTPAVIAENGTVLFGGVIDGNVYSLDPDGHLQWTFPTGKVVGSTPAISSSGVIYVGTQDGHLYALDAAGHPQWALKTKGEVGSPTIGSDGTIYVQSGDGVLHAIPQPRNGGLAGEWPKLDANESNTARTQ